MKATQFFLFMGPKLWSFRRVRRVRLAAVPRWCVRAIIGMNNLDEVAPKTNAAPTATRATRDECW
jgi:membrane-associated protease RseP (regulator of RpoE activity)